MASSRLTRTVRFRQTPVANSNYESIRTAGFIEEKRAGKHMGLPALSYVSSTR